jgi:excisionase family DNA binding protein
MKTMKPTIANEATAAATDAPGAAAPARQELMTPAEMAAIYKVQKSTFLAWFHAGKIPAEVCVGKVLRFDAARVARALAKGAAAEVAAKTKLKPFR